MSGEKKSFLEAVSRKTVAASAADQAAGKKTVDPKKVVPGGMRKDRMMLVGVGVVAVLFIGVVATLVLTNQKPPAVASYSPTEKTGDGQSIIIPATGIMQAPVTAVGSPRRAYLTNGMPGPAGTAGTTSQDAARPTVTPTPAPKKAVAPVVAAAPRATNNSWGSAGGGGGYGSTPDPGTEAAKKSALFIAVSGVYRPGADANTPTPAQYQGAGGDSTNVPPPSPGAMRGPAQGTSVGWNSQTQNAPQDPNSAFYNNGRDSNPNVSQNTDLVVAAGTIVPATLITPINSDLPGQIVAQVNTNVYDSLTGNNLLIPQGTRLIASYNSVIGWGQNRVQIGWSQMIRPDGVVVNLGNMPGTDAGGTSGVEAEVDGHFWDYLLAMGFMVGTQMAVNEMQYEVNNAQGLSPGATMLGNTVVDSVTPPINQVGQAYLNHQMARPATLHVKQGAAVSIFMIGNVPIPAFRRGK